MRQPLFTKRLLLRDVSIDDASLLSELDSDPEVLKFIGSGPQLPLEAYRDRIAEVYLPWQSHPWQGLWLIFDRATVLFMGWTFIRPAPLSRVAKDLGWNRADEFEVGYRLRQEAWGKGIANEATTPLIALALNDPEVSAVVACVRADHQRSRRVLEKLGLVVVGEVQQPDEPLPTLKLELPFYAMRNGDSAGW